MYPEEIFNGNITGRKLSQLTIFLYNSNFSKLLSFTTTRLDVDI